MLPSLISAVAVPVNRFMFNHVVTEAKFTRPGAMQGRGISPGGVQLDVMGVVREG